MSVIALARELGKAIQADPSLARLTKANEANENDTQLAEMIEKFNGLRAELNAEIMKPEEEKNQEVIMAKDEEFRTLYNEIMNRPSMVEFTEAKEESDRLLAYVMKIISGSVNGENPDDIQEEDEAAGCSGSCASCSGCH